MRDDYISRDAAKAAIHKALNEGQNYFLMLDRIPAADVHSVIRCRDCENADYSGMGNGGVWCDKMERALDENGWCAWGRKANNNIQYRYWCAECNSKGVVSEKIAIKQNGNILCPNCGSPMSIGEDV